MNIAQKMQKILQFFVKEPPVKKEDLGGLFGRDNWWHQCQAYNRQRKCDHLKGHSPRDAKQGRWLDYNVSIHRFITNETRIRCLYGCGWEVYNKPEFRFKWAVGMAMVNKSTNTRTSSEIVMRTT